MKKILFTPIRLVFNPIGKVRTIETIIPRTFLGFGLVPRAREKEIIFYVKRPYFQTLRKFLGIIVLLFMMVLID